MNCPVCNVQLVMTDRQGVEIDYCPRCRGVWLDRGELDKIIERSETAFDAGRHDQPQQQHRRHEEHDRQRYDEHNRYSDHGSNYSQQQQPYKKHKKKESFLGNLFDFD